MIAPVTLGALRLPGPILAAAGSLGFGAVPVPGTAGDDTSGTSGTSEEAPDAPLTAVTTGISWRSRGGAPPRLAETAAGAVYLPGSATLGVDVALRRFARAWALRGGQGAPVIVNLRWDAESPGELALAAADLQGVRGVAGLELDLTAQPGSQDAPVWPDPALVRGILEDVRRASTLPILVKLAFDVPDREAVLRAAASGGADGVTLGAGLPASAEGGRPRGRLVGSATFPVVLDLIAGLAPEAPLPVIACGGVTTAVQARALLRAGAAAVQVGSAHLANPRAAVDVWQGL